MKVEISEDTINLVNRFERCTDELDELRGDDKKWRQKYEEYNHLRTKCAIRLALIVEFGGDHAGS